MIHSPGKRHDNPVIFLMGPTGAGKTRVALALAERMPVEIISVDSTLVYRGLDIGSAKPNPALRQRIPHHLIDIRDPAEQYSAAQFRHDARACIEAIQARGRQPLLVGGTGLYFRALEQGLADLPDANLVLREQLNAELAQHGSQLLHKRLARVDPEAAARIHPNDPQRVTRALEIFQLTGQPMSILWRAQTPAPLITRPIKLVLAPADRTKLHAVIADRFHDMLNRGFINEVRALRARGDLTPAKPALRAVGYREIWRYLDGELSYVEMCERGIIATRQLAKRQLTWLRREPGCHWYDSGEPGLLAAILQKVAEKPDFQTLQI